MYLYLIQEKKMKIQEEAKQVVQKAVKKMKSGGGIKQVIWVGAGGSFGGFYGANYFMHQKQKTFLPQCIPVVNLFMLRQKA